MRKKNIKISFANKINDTSYYIIMRVRAHMKRYKMYVNTLFLQHCIYWIIHIMHNSAFLRNASRCALFDRPHIEMLADARFLADRTYCAYTIYTAAPGTGAVAVNIIYIQHIQFPAPESVKYI